MEHQLPGTYQKSDIVTLCSIAIIGYIIANVIHEGIGHGGMCLIVGGTPVHLSSADFEGNYDFVSDVGRRLVAAAGTFANLIASLLFWSAVKNFKKASYGVRYFLWFSMSINYFLAAGYPLFSGVMGIGDWVAVVAGYEPVWLWRIGLSLIGLFSYAWGVWYSLTLLTTMIGSADDERLSIAKQLTVPPYIIGGIAATIGSLFNPIGPFVFFTSAAAHFGGTSALAWMWQMLRKERWFPKYENDPLVIAGNVRWIIVSIILLLIHIFVLGPSIQFNQ